MNPVQWMGKVNWNLKFMKKIKERIKEAEKEEKEIKEQGNRK